MKYNVDKTNLVIKQAELSRATLEISSEFGRLPLEVVFHWRPSYSFKFEYDPKVAAEIFNF